VKYLDDIDDENT
jgi:hypothetical protein